MPRHDDARTYIVAVDAADDDDTNIVVEVGTHAWWL